MRIVVHAGMHKTGSSSIQETLFQNSFPGVTYAPWRNANQSGLFVLLFHEEPERHHGFQKTGAKSASLRVQREEWQSRLDKALEQGAETLVLSAEAISAGNAANIEAQKKMLDHLRRYSDDVELVAYVRPPAGYMQSAFQQKVKGGGLGSFELEKLWPNYRRRFESLLEIFGDDRVSLRVFDRNMLADGDVVKDFIGALGADISSGQIVRANESLSLEALSLLYSQRRLGHGLISGFPRAMSANSHFIETLGKFGSGKVRFAREALLPVFEKKADDLSWIEDKLGKPVNDLPDSDEGLVVANEEDLLAIAETQADALHDHLVETRNPSADQPRSALARDLDLLYFDSLARFIKPAQGQKAKRKPGK